jgi:hypothetical protein
MVGEDLLDDGIPRDASDQFAIYASENQDFVLGVHLKGLSAVATVGRN